MRYWWVVRDEWRNVDSGERVASCTIILTGANNLTRAIRERMTVLLAEPNIEPWLTASAAGLELLWSAPNDACAFVRFRGPARSKLASVNTL
jgi:putative SOS response-associated peptidase YedK